MFRSRASLSVPLLLAACVALGSGASCTRTKPAPGGLMVAVETDLSAPKDVTALALYVLSDDQLVFAHEEYVRPDGSIQFPATLAVMGTKTPGAKVRIRVVAFKREDTKIVARVVREVFTTLPLTRQALMRMPVQWLSWGSAEGELPSERLGTASTSPRTLATTPYNPFETIINNCPPGQTNVAGECVDATVDSAKLPDFAPADIFGASGTEEPGGCFDVRACFAEIIDVPLVSNVAARDCHVDAGADTPLGKMMAADATKLNLAAKLPPGTQGECTAANCLVPIDQGGSAGFTVDGTLIRFPVGLCTKADAAQAKGQPFGIVASKVCATKVPRQALCGVATVTPGVDAGNGAGDGSAGDGSVIPNSFGPVETVDTAVNSPSAIALDGANVFVVSVGGVVRRIPRGVTAASAVVFDAGTIDPDSGTVTPVPPPASGLFTIGKVGSTSIAYRLATGSFGAPPAVITPEVIVSDFEQGLLKVWDLSPAAMHRDIFSQPEARDIVTAGAAIYWLAGNEVRSCSLDPTQACAAGTKVRALAGSGDRLAVSSDGKTLVYTTTDGTLGACQLPCQTELGTVKLAGRAGALAVTNDTLFATVPPADEQGTGSIVRVPLAVSGAPVTSLQTQPFASGLAIGVPPAEIEAPHGLATDGKYVYVTTLDAIHAVSVDGQRTVDVASPVKRPRAIALDDVQVYFTAFGDPTEGHGYVMRVGKPGDAVSGSPPTPPTGTGSKTPTPTPSPTGTATVSIPVPLPMPTPGDRRTP